MYTVFFGENYKLGMSGQVHRTEKPNIRQGSDKVSSDRGYIHQLRTTENHVEAGLRDVEGLV